MPNRKTYGSEPGKGVGMARFLGGVALLIVGALLLFLSYVFYTESNIPAAPYLIFAIVCWVGAYFLVRF
jgi:hypothetical protein